MEDILFYTQECQDPSITRRVAWIVSGITEYPSCLHCGNVFYPTQVSFKHGFGRQYCSQQCVVKCEIRKQKTQDKCLLERGVTHTGKDPATTTKRRKTNLEKYGCEVPANNPEIKEQIKQDNLVKFGDEHVWGINSSLRKGLLETMESKYGVQYYVESPDFLEKSETTSLQNWGTKSPMSNPEVQLKAQNTSTLRYGGMGWGSKIINDKIKRTNIEVYGFEHPMQNPEICAKSQEIKTYITQLPSGKEIKYQGYELVAIIELLKVFQEEDIIFDIAGMPQIWYIGTDRKNHRYYPDLYLPGENLIIEVKGEYTYKETLETNLLKGKACLAAGFNFEFWVCNEVEVRQILTIPNK